MPQYSNEVTIIGLITTLPVFQLGVVEDKDFAYSKLLTHEKGKSMTFPFICWGDQARKLRDVAVINQQVAIKGKLVSEEMNPGGGTYRFEINCHSVIMGKVPTAFKSFHPDARATNPYDALAQLRDHVARHTKDKKVYKIGEEIYDITNGWTMQTAYEANKKSQTCVVCEKALTLHPAVGVMYCSCVDKLPKE